MLLESSTTSALGMLPEGVKVHLFSVCSSSSTSGRFRFLLHEASVCSCPTPGNAAAAAAADDDDDDTPRPPKLDDEEPGSVKSLIAADSPAWPAANVWYGLWVWLLEKIFGRGGAPGGANRRVGESRVADSSVEWRIMEGEEIGWVRSEETTNTFHVPRSTFHVPRSTFRALYRTLTNMSSLVALTDVRLAKDWPVALGPLWSVRAAKVLGSAHTPVAQWSESAVDEEDDDEEEEEEEEAEEEEDEDAAAGLAAYDRSWVDGGLVVAQS